MFVYSLAAGGENKKVIKKEEVKFEN